MAKKTKNSKPSRLSSKLSGRTKAKSNDVGGMLDTASIKKSTKKRVKKVKVKTELYVKGDDKAIADEVPKKVVNKSVNYQRKKVLREGKKFIYPLRHGKHKIAWISSIISILLIISFGLFSFVSLYKVQSTGSLFYKLTDIVPVPVGSVANERIAYEEYLFELNRNTHYIANHEKVDFDNEEGQLRLVELKKQARDKVLENVVTRQLAEKHGIEISDEELQAEVDIFREQEGAVREEGQPDKLEPITEKFFGYDVSGFERDLELQLMQQKLAPILDTTVQKRIDAALAELAKGTEFGEVAQEYTDDAGTSPTGGEFSSTITKEDQVLPRPLVDAIFKLEEGQYGKVPVNTFYETLSGFNPAVHIPIKIDQLDSDSVRAGHILFLYDSFSNLAVNELEQAAADANWYIDFE